MRLKVWDSPTRLFHWSLVASVGTCAVTGFVLTSRWFGWHFAAGYIIAALLVFRLIWAVLGSEHSRWTGFMPRPAQVIAHLAGLLRGQPPHAVGHNPAGGAMVLTLLLTLIFLAVSGLIALGGLDKQGPLAAFVSFAQGRTIKEFHELAAYLLLGLAALHVAGVLAESWLDRQSLILSMITGVKRVPDGTPQPRPARTRPALLALGLTALGLGGLVVTGLSLPPQGWRPLADIPPAYAKECGACHIAYHPSLLPAASWAKLMGSLDDHFGEDASLPSAPTQAIAQWLAANAAETWDTKPANLLRQVSAAEPRRMTETPWWKRKHRHIPDTVFTQKTVKMRGNCAACHKDADAGTFRVQAIGIPTP